MNACLCDFFRIREKPNRLARELPQAFDMVRQSMPKDNPPLGILRERGIIGFLVAEFDKDNVNVLKEETDAGLMLRFVKANY